MKRVLDVTRDAEGLVRHTVTRQLHVGDEVLVTVDWHRRYDHMQQHTGRPPLSYRIISHSHIFLSIFVANFLPAFSIEGGR